MIFISVSEVIKLKQLSNKYHQHQFKKKRHIANAICRNLIDSKIEGQLIEFIIDFSNQSIN